MAEGDDKPRGSVPVPDPTILTTQAVDRALAGYREVVTEQIRNLKTRLGGMDRETELVAGDLVKALLSHREELEQIREECRHANEALRESYVLQIKNVLDVAMEKFHAIDTQFKERDTRTDQTDKERKISLDAALAAAKEAVKEQNTASALAIGKSEAGIKEKIDALVLLMTTSNKALDEKITDLKERQDRGEGQQTGVAASQQQSNWSTGQLVSVGLALAAAAIAVAIALFK